MDSNGMYLKTIRVWYDEPSHQLVYLFRKIVDNQVSDYTCCLNDIRHDKFLMDKVIDYYEELYRKSAD